MSKGGLGVTMSQFGIILGTWAWVQSLVPVVTGCLLYTSDAADERSSVDLGGRRIIKKKNKVLQITTLTNIQHN